MLFNAFSPTKRAVSSLTERCFTNFDYKTTVIPHNLCSHKHRDDTEITGSCGDSGNCNSIWVDIINIYQAMTLIFIKNCNRMGHYFPLNRELKMWKMTINCQFEHFFLRLNWYVFFSIFVVADFVFFVRIKYISLYVIDTYFKLSNYLTVWILELLFITHTVFIHWQHQFYIHTFLWFLI